jgi:hypothetical protein
MKIFINSFQFFTSRDSSVGIATGYGMDGTSSVLCLAIFFSSAQHPALGPTQPPNQCMPGRISPGVKRPERLAHHSPPSSFEVKSGGAILPLPHASLRRGS